MADENLGISAIEKEIRFQSTFWKVERFAWALLALVPLAAIAGIFAHGIFSDKITRTPNSALSVEYDRFQRMTVQSRFVIRVRSAQSDEIRLRLSSSFQQSYDIQSLQPPPARSRADTEWLDLFFHPPEGGELVAVLWAVPRQFGSLDLQVQTDNSGPLEIPIFIYP
jgi:hypothetical protein